MQHYAPCHKTLNRAFINPHGASVQARRAAVKICQHCPIRQRCALDALESGSTLDRGKLSPAAGVIMAGVICRGYESAAELAAVAGVEVPEEYRDGRAGTKRVNLVATGQPCRNCQRPLYRWTRHKEDVPPGHVMAYARGFCTGCRAAYNAYVKRLPDSQRRYGGMKKEINRRHTVIETERSIRRREYRERHIAAFAEAQGVPVDSVLGVEAVAELVGAGRDTVQRHAVKRGCLLEIPRTDFYVQKRFYVNILGLVD